MNWQTWNTVICSFCWIGFHDCESNFLPFLYFNISHHRYCSFQLPYLHQLVPNYFQFLYVCYIHLLDPAESRLDEGSRMKQKKWKPMGVAETGNYCMGLGLWATGFTWTPTLIWSTDNCRHKKILINATLNVLKAS